MTLAVRNLAFGHAGKRVGVVDELTLRGGESLCVLGPNGSGKTTLFRTLLGLLPALGGEATVDGESIAALPRREVARRIAFVPQAAPAAFEFSLLEMVEMGRTAHLGAFSRPSRDDTARAAQALDRLGLAALAQRGYGEVSGGERQLALVARALATGAGHIVLDEPAAHLDFANQARLLAELARLRDAGIAVLLCSHDPGHAVALGGRALLLERGGVLAQGPVDEVLDGASLSRLYRVDVRRTPAWRPHA